MSQIVAKALRPTDRIDLHLHTTYSDGHWQPADLFDHLAAEHFALVAVTDHDQLRHLDEMRVLGAARGIAVLAGVEVTTDWRGQVAHLLCYGFDPAGGALAEVTSDIHDEQLANTRAVRSELLHRGYHFGREAEALAEVGGQVTRPDHNIRLLIEHGYVPDFAAGLALITDAGYRSISAPLATAIDAARADGGVAIIAHPGRRATGFTLYTPALLDRARESGLAIDGIEVYYPTYSAEQVREYEAYVAAHGWLAGAGSDSHGPRQRLPVAYEARQAADLLARCGVPVTASPAQ